jgi:hypothetical protein
MAKASRVAAQTQKTLAELSEQADRMERMLLLMMTKKQREEYEAMLGKFELYDPTWNPMAEKTEAESNEQPESS